MEEQRGNCRKMRKDGSVEENRERGKKKMKKVREKDECRGERGSTGK